MFHARDYLEVARFLARARPRDQIRRSISTVYYAGFHGILELLADVVALQKNRPLPLYERVYRKVQHGSVRSICKSLTEAQSPLWIEWGIVTDAQLKAVAKDFVELHGAREVANYGGQATPILGPTPPLMPIEPNVSSMVWVASTGTTGASFWWRR